MSDHAPQYRDLYATAGPTLSPTGKSAAWLGGIAAETPRMQDSGQREEFSTGAARDAGDSKIRPDLISPFAQEREGEWMRQGAKKYTARNWEKGIPFTRCIASLFRHLLAFMLRRTDEDHLAAIRCNAGFLIHYEECIRRGVLPESLDDRPDYTLL